MYLPKVWSPPRITANEADSPAGRPSFNLVGNNSCWYTDMTGSGNETISHLYENGRITVMFSACRSDMLDRKHHELTWAVSTIEGPARIVRLFGKGRVFERNSAEFRQLLPDGDDRILPVTRAIIWIDFNKGSHSTVN
jgi:hypothetical protein